MNRRLKGKYLSYDYLTNRRVVAVIFITVVALILYLFNTTNITLSSLQIFRRRHNNGSWVEDIFRSGRSMRILFETTLTSPGVILRTAGGIGNQLFQFACAYALAKDKNWTLYTYFIPSQDPTTRGFYRYQREFVLDHFEIPLENIIDGSTRIPGLVKADDRHLWENTYSSSAQFVETSGYCQSPAYWLNHTEEIVKMVKPREEALNLAGIQSVADEIEESESVAVHVRRGDFLKDKNKGFFVPMSFQRGAIRKIIDILESRGKTPVFFVFSDDIEHTERNLKDFESRNKFVYVSAKHFTSIQDFYLMTLCKHIILPNSTFSWWAAFLNENKEKIVIASAFNPEFWKLWNSEGREKKRFLMSLHGTLYHPKNWIVIDPFVGGFESVEIET